MKRLVVLIAAPALGLLVVGCAVAPQDRAPVEEREPVQELEPETTRSTGSPAVVELSEGARRAMRDGRLEHAAQLLERAIRIEPQNGALWHELARVRFEQGNIEQAAQLAARSNTMLGRGSALKVRNDELIEAAREAGVY